MLSFHNKRRRCFNLTVFTHHANTCISWNKWFFLPVYIQRRPQLSFRHLLAKQNRTLSPWHTALSDFPPRKRFSFPYFRSYPSLKTPQHGVVLCCIPPLMSRDIILWWQRFFLNYSILSRDDALPHHLLPAWYYIHKYIRMYIYTCPRALINATSQH